MTVSAAGHSVGSCHFQSTRLESVFTQCFAVTEQTQLVGGASEPLYQPASEPGKPHVLYYRDDYFASALHEVAHWCIAGSGRRLQVDFGYWYEPDGRSDTQQREFEAVEYRPQALEWFFAKACNFPFGVSVDNLDVWDGKLPDTSDFRRRVVEQSRHWSQVGLPLRAHQFYSGLCREFGTRVKPTALVFHWSELD
ncbi:MAG: transporting ATPase [Halieaceae bacterium]|jgi:elongation factor P hydroxylase|nr:transporting ATPase [Halieaceae bacterium]